MRSASLSFWSLACRRTRQRFARDDRGATAIEFAMIAGPLVFMIMACFELALVVLVSVSLDNATEVAAREIRTGITTKGNSSLEVFRQKVCDNMGWLGASCMDNLKVDVNTYDSFALVPTLDPIKDGNFDDSEFGYDVGAGGKIQLVRAYYSWTLITPFLDAGMLTLEGGDAVLSTRVVFKNEPF